MTCVTGVSGSGKSTLINDTLYRAGRRDHQPQQLQRSGATRGAGSAWSMSTRSSTSARARLGRTPRSNPATYTGPVHADPRTVRRHAGSPLARLQARPLQLQRQGRPLRGLPGRRRHPGGNALSAGHLRALRRVQGRRYNRETLEIRYKGRSIHEVLDMTVEDACEFFANVPMVAPQAGDADGRRPVLPPTRPERHHPVGR